MKLTVLTPEKEVFKDDVKSVKVPGISGQFEILNNHAPLVSALSKGSVIITNTDSKKVRLNITGGFIEIMNNEIALLASGVAE
jgi:F-type H+-transporting ATPase subunit epsilon